MKAPDGSTLQAGNVYRGVLGTATFIYSNASIRMVRRRKTPRTSRGTETAEATRQTYEVSPALPR